MDMHVNRSLSVVDIILLQLVVNIRLSLALASTACTILQGLHPFFYSDQGMHPEYAQGHPPEVDHPALVLEHSHCYPVVGIVREPSV